MIIGAGNAEEVVAAELRARRWRSGMTSPSLIPGTSFELSAALSGLIRRTEADDEDVGKFVRELPAREHRVPLHLKHDQDRQAHHERRARARGTPDAAAKLLAEQA